MKFIPDLSELIAAIEARARQHGSIRAAEVACGVKPERFRGVIAGKSLRPGPDTWIAVGLTPPAWSKHPSRSTPQIVATQPKPIRPARVGWDALVRNHFRRERRLRRHAAFLAARLEAEPDLGRGLAAAWGRNDRADVRRFWDERRGA